MFVVGRDYITTQPRKQEETQIIHNFFDRVLYPATPIGRGRAVQVRYVCSLHYVWYHSPRDSTSTFSKLIKIFPGKIMLAILAER